MCLEGGWIGRRVEGRWRGIEEEMEVMDRECIYVNTHMHMRITC